MLLVGTVLSFYMKLCLVDPDTAAGKNSGNAQKQVKDRSSPVLLIHYAGPLTSPGEPPTDASTLPPGRRLVILLNICILQGLSFIKARLLSMEIPAHVGANGPKLVRSEHGSAEEGVDSERQADRFMKIDPYRGSWGLRFLELELYNPTDVVFEIGVSVQLKNSNEEDSSFDSNNAEFHYPKRRIDRDYTARVLIPLEHLKPPVLDGSFLVKDSQINGTASGRSSIFSERNTQAELNASIKNLISRIKVRWQSGRNSSGELNIKDAMQAALQSSVMDVLLPDPLTPGFRLAKSNSGHEVKFDSPEESDVQVPYVVCNSSIVARDMTPMEVLERNNTKKGIRISLSICCGDVAGENCFEGEKATVLWAGVLSGINIEVPPLEEMKHSSLCFLVPGEYTLFAAAVIDDPNEILRARAKK